MQPYSLELVERYIQTNMRKFAIILAVAALCVGAFAQKGTPKKADKPMKCAVTGEKLDVAKATKGHMFTDYKGRRYFFCCDGCPQTFKKNPAKYAKTATSIPTPTTSAKK